VEQIPDAPWIREAELYGVPDRDPVRCPICGAEADTIYTDKNGDALGCEWCVSCEDAFDWWDEHGEH